jgi:hypothetical protein
MKALLRKAPHCDNPPHLDILTWNQSPVSFSSHVLSNSQPELCLKALTDHFGGGSRVVSFDPYSETGSLEIFFLLILKGFHHKISKKPMEAA